MAAPCLDQLKDSENHWGKQLVKKEESFAAPHPGQGFPGRSAVTDLQGQFHKPHAGGCIIVIRRDFGEPHGTVKGLCTLHMSEGIQTESTKPGGPGMAYSGRSQSAAKALALPSRPHIKAFDFRPVFGKSTNTDRTGSTTIRAQQQQSPPGRAVCPGQPRQFGVEISQAVGAGNVGPIFGKHHPHRLKVRAAGDRRNDRVRHPRIPLKPTTPRRWPPPVPGSRPYRPCRGSSARHRRPPVR